MSAQLQLNPQITKVMVGTRELRPVTIYPLSAHDQFELTKQLAEVINDIAKGVDLKSLTEAEAVEKMRGIVASNVEMILGYVCNKEKDKIPTLEELTNLQISEIALLIFSMNYEGLIKNFKDLFEKGKVLFQAKTRSRRTI